VDFLAEPMCHGRGVREGPARRALLALIPRILDAFGIIFEKKIAISIIPRDILERRFLIAYNYFLKE
jgi:hypothetical protein